MKPLLLRARALAVVAAVAVPGTAALLKSAGDPLVPAARASTVPLAASPLAAHEEFDAALAERRQHARIAASRSEREAKAKKVWPADGGRTGWWGEWRGHRSHFGIDLDGEIGDPIYAAALGTVVHAGPAPAGYGGYGNLVLIDHDHGVVTLYAHLTDVHVVAGQHVPAGHVVGTMGVTGNVTGSHLHFEVRVNGGLIDPEQWLPPRG